MAWSSTQGRAAPIGNLDIDTPVFIRFGKVTKDEVFVVRQEEPEKGSNSRTPALNLSSASATSAPNVHQVLPSGG